MDYSHSPIAAPVVLSSVALNFGEPSLSGLTTELGEGSRHRDIQGQTNNLSPAASGMFSPSNPLKQCRSTSDMDVDSRDDRRGPMKLARTDSFMNSQQSDLKMQMSSSGTLGSLVRSNSMVSDGRLGCSPTNSTASDGALLGNESNLMTEQRMARNDSMVSGHYGGGNVRSLYHHPAYSMQPSGLPLSMNREVSSLGMHHDADRGRAPVLFTSNQLHELQQQALVLKYMMSGVNVPAELLNPIRSSVPGLSTLPTASHHLPILPWGGYHLGFTTNTDPEPGRCRRTDGKKWRCARDVVPDQKYCERHMHRGRHRSRKPADNQTTSSSQAISVAAAAAASSSGANSSVSLAATRAPSAILPSASINTQQHRPASNLGMKPYSGANSPSGSGGISVGSSISASHFQMPLQSSAAGGGALSARYLNGIAKTELDLGAEQMFFAEATGSTRGIGQDLHSMNGLSMLSSVNNSWRSMPSKAPPAPQPKANNSPNMLHYNSPQLRSLLGQDFGLMSEANSVNMSMAQQQHSFLGGGYGTVEAVGVGRESEGQPLRHFFDDWPRSRDPSSLSWSDVDDERSNRNCSTTQLSISIPMASSDFSGAANSSSPRGKLSLSPLKLSMSRDGEDDALGVDATQMGLGVGMGNEDRHRQTNWIPIAWETPVGGPLAEVLQSSTPRGCKSSGLNLMTDGWESSPRDSPRMASPADGEGADGLAGSAIGLLEGSKSMD